MSAAVSMATFSEQIALAKSGQMSTVAHINVIDEPPEYTLYQQGKAYIAKVDFTLFKKRRAFHDEAWLIQIEDGNYGLEFQLFGMSDGAILATIAYVPGNDDVCDPEAFWWQSTRNLDASHFFGNDTKACIWEQTVAGWILWVVDLDPQTEQ
jgi:hypothetical protein